MATRLDIFEVLKNIDDNNISFYTSLDEASKKSFQPIVVERWFSGVKNKKQILCINQFVNSMVFPLYEHPDLLYKLMIAASDGTHKKYTWNKKPSKLGSKPTCVKIIAEYYSISTIKAKEALPSKSESEIMEMADELGYDKDIIKKIKTEKNAKD